MGKIVISNIEQYEAVMKAIEELSGATNGSKEHNLLIDLLDAAAEWDHSQGGEVTGDTQPMNGKTTLL